MLDEHTRCDHLVAGEAVQQIHGGDAHEFATKFMSQPAGDLEAIILKRIELLNNHQFDK